MLPASGAWALPTIAAAAPSSHLPPSGPPPALHLFSPGPVINTYIPRPHLCPEPARIPAKSQARQRMIQIRGKPCSVLGMDTRGWIPGTPQIIHRLEIDELKIHLAQTLDRMLKVNAHNVRSLLLLFCRLMVGGLCQTNARASGALCLLSVIDLPRPRLLPRSAGTQAVASDLSIQIDLHSYIYSPCRKFYVLIYRLLYLWSWGSVSTMPWIFHHAATKHWGIKVSTG